jgi:hypothetical protein
MGATQCLCRGSQAASLLCSSRGHSLLSCSSIHPCIHLILPGGNKGIGMKGWAVVARTLSSKWNLKKLNLGKSLHLRVLSYWAIVINIDMVQPLERVFLSVPFYYFLSIYTFLHGYLTYSHCFHSTPASLNHISFFTVHSNHQCFCFINLFTLSQDTAIWMTRRWLLCAKGSRHTLPWKSSL